MDVYVGAPACPGSDQSDFEIARGAVELGELNQARSRLCSPRWRLHSLLAFFPVARRLGASTLAMEREVRVCLETILARQRVGCGMVLARRIQSDLLTWTSEDSVAPGHLQALAVMLSQPHGQPTLRYVRTLLEAGRVTEARAFADNLQEVKVRHHALRLTASGLWRAGGGRCFVGPAFSKDFLPSLERFFAMTETLGSAPSVNGVHLVTAERLLAGLKGAERQQALAYWAPIMYRACGRRQAEQVVRAIRYQSRLQQARFLVLQQALDAGSLEDAWRLLEPMAGVYRERGCLHLADALIRRGDGCRARRLLARVVHKPLQAERTLLFRASELGSVTGNVDRLKRSYGRWLAARPQQCEDLSAFDRLLPTLASRWILLALRTGWRGSNGGSVEIPDWVRWRDLQQLTTDRRGLRSLLAHVDDHQVDLRHVLRSMRRIAGDVDQPIWSEHLCCRAELLAATLDQPRRSTGRDLKTSQILVRGLRGHSEGANLSTAADSRDRCAWDEGVSLSPRALRRRRVLLQATKWCLKTWLQGGEPVPAETVRSRLRVLTNLEGGLAIGVLERALRPVRAPSSGYVTIFFTLVSLAPRRAAELVFGDHLTLFFEEINKARELLLELEDHRVLESGFTELWLMLMRRVRARFGVERGREWLCELMDAWPAASRIPTLAAVRCCLADTVDNLTVTGDRLIARAERRLVDLTGTPTSKLPTALLDDPNALARFDWLRPGWLLSNTAGRTDQDRRADLEVLRGTRGDIDPLPIRKLARSLSLEAGQQQITRRWLAGAYPWPDRSSAVELPELAGLARYRVRFLDKRQDLFTYLHFADCVPCCFNRANRYFKQWGLRQWVLALWKDPLSFCFHVERLVDERQWRPCGFVFGSYALCQATPAVLLNGIYLHRKHEQLRAEILHAIEEMFCRPLGVRWVAIANRYGGCGNLPETYVLRSVIVQRLRALRFKGRPVTAIYDDISCEVNQTMLMSHLYWRNLRE